MEPRLAALPGKKSLVALYVGALGYINDLEMLLDSVQDLRPDVRNHLGIAVVGSGPRAQWLQDEIINRGLDKTFLLLPPVAKKDVPKLFKAAHVSLVLVRPNPVLDMASSNKLFDSLAAGIPPVVNSAGRTQELIRDTGAGWTVEPGDSSALTDLYRQWVSGDADEMRKEFERRGAIARRIARERFDRDVISSRVLSACIDARKAYLSPQWAKNGYRVKYVLDLLFAIPALFLLLPVFMVIASAIKLDSPGDLPPSSKPTGELVFCSPRTWPQTPLA